MNSLVNPLKVFVSKTERHHSLPFGTLVICDGSPSGRTLSRHRAEKNRPQSCSECGYYRHARSNCRLGYFVFSGSEKPCRQGILRKDLVEKEGY